jgi:hypothetical protein
MRDLLRNLLLHMQPKVVLRFLRRFSMLPSCNPKLKNS